MATDTAKVLETLGKMTVLELVELKKAIEEEWGVSTGRIHPHNGYYAGDFRTTRSPEPPPSAIALRVTGTSTVSVSTRRR